MVLVKKRKKILFKFVDLSKKSSSSKFKPNAVQNRDKESKVKTPLPHSKITGLKVPLCIENIPHKSVDTHYTET